MRKAERSAVTIRRPWRYAVCGVNPLYPDLLFRFHDTIVAEELFHLNAGNMTHLRHRKPGRSEMNSTARRSPP